MSAAAINSPRLTDLAFLSPTPAIKNQQRDQFEMECDAFIIGEQLKEERLRAGLTQEQLADRIGTKKSFISRVEKGHADIQLSTLVKLFRGLGRQISVRVL